MIEKDEEPPQVVKKPQEATVSKAEERAANEVEREPAKEEPIPAEAKFDPREEEKQHPQEASDQEEIVKLAEPKASEVPNASASQLSKLR